MRLKTITLTLLLLALAPGRGLGQHGQLALFQDDDELVNGGAATPRGHRSTSSRRSARTR